MTSDKTPSDPEIEELARPFIRKVGGHCVNDDAIPDNGSIEDFASAVLAWGSPVVATKVSIPTHTMEQEFQNHYRRGFEAGKKAGSPVVAGEPCVICGSGEPYTGTCGSNDPRALCKSITTPQPTQAQAGAVPLADYKAYALIDSMGWSLDDQEKDDMLRLLRATEDAHGIKEGGQHVALTPERIDATALKWSNKNWVENGSRFNHDFARAIEAEVRAQDTALIRQLVDAVQTGFDQTCSVGRTKDFAQLSEALVAGRARLNNGACASTRGSSCQTED